MKKRGFASVPVLIIAFILMVLTSVGMWMEYQPTTDNKTTIQQEDFSNWKTYRNEEFGFEFDYPKEGVVIENENEIEYLSSIEVKHRLENKDDFYATSWFSARVTVKPLSDKVVNGDYRSYAKSNYESSLNPFKEIKVGGIDAYSMPKEDGSGNTLIWVYNNENEYLINLQELDSSFRKEFLDSFKFTSNQNSLTENQILSSYYIKGGSRCNFMNGSCDLGSLEGQERNGQISQITFGDIDNDGNKDAVAIITERYGGTGAFKNIALYINDNGNPIFKNYIEIGDRTVINSIDIENNNITLNTLTHDSGEPMCCPNTQKIMKFKVENNLLVEVK